MSKILPTIDNAQLHQIAPAVFANKPSADVSEKYQFVSTIEIVERARALGFRVVSATQNQAESNYHSVRMQMGNCPLKGIRDVVFPQISINNSHDRSRRFSIMAGLFREICANGMIAEVRTADGKSLGFSGRALHVKGISDRITAMTESAISAANGAGSIIKRMEKIKLDRTAIRKLVMPALEAWYGKPTIKKMKLDALAWAEPRREEDLRLDLWTTMNVVQENFMRGGVVLPSGRKTSGFEGTQLTASRSTALNLTMWESALALLN